MSEELATLRAELQRAREALRLGRNALTPHLQCMDNSCKQCRRALEAALSSTPRPQNPPASVGNPPVFESNPPASETPQLYGTNTEALPVQTPCEVCGKEKGHP
jgi:hypothetical protein